MSWEYYQKLLKIAQDASVALMKQQREFISTGRWHVDCCCDECNAIRAYQSLSFWQKLKARKIFAKWFKTDIMP